MMVRASHMVVFVFVCCGLSSAAWACAPCSTANSPPALRPCINTKLEQLACFLFQLLSGLVRDVKLVVALVLVLLNVILETLKGLGINVGSLLGIVTGCYEVAKEDSGLAAILNKLLKDLGKVLNLVLKLLSNRLSGLLG